MTRVHETLRFRVGLLALVLALAASARGADDDPLAGGRRRRPARPDPDAPPAASANLSGAATLRMTYAEALPPGEIRRHGGLVNAPKYIIEMMRQKRETIPAFYEATLRPKIIIPERGPWEVRLEVGPPTKFVHPQIKRDVRGSLDAEAHYVTLKLRFWSQQLTRAQADRLRREGELRLAVTGVLEAVKTWRKGSNTIPLTVRRPTAGEMAFHLHGQGDGAVAEELFFDVAYVVRVRPRSDRMPEGDTIRVTVHAGPKRLQLTAQRSGEGAASVFTSKPFVLVSGDDGTGIAPPTNLRVLRGTDPPARPDTDTRGDDQ